MDIDAIAATRRKQAGAPRSLSAYVLAELGRHGVAGAFDALREQLRSLDWRPAALALSHAQRDHARPLVDTADLSALLEHPSWTELVAATPEWRKWALIEPRLAPLLVEPDVTPPETAANSDMSTDQLLSFGQKKHRARAVALLSRRRGEASVAAMRDAALGEDPLRRRVAYQALGRQNDESLVEHCEERLTSEPPKAEYIDLMLYLVALDPNKTRSLARRLITYHGVPGTAARRLLAHRAEAQDLDVLESQLPVMFARDEQFAIRDIAMAIGTVGHAESAQTLVELFEAVAYPFVRYDILVATHRCSPVAAMKLAPDALDDCDDSTRLWATNHAKPSSDVNTRLRQLAGDPLEWDEIRTCAEERIVGFGRTEAEE